VALIYNFWLTRAFNKTDWEAFYSEYIDIYIYLSIYLSIYIYIYLFICLHTVLLVTERERVFV
jgi:hypothetical protein